jgi:hypothetical protein
MTKVARSKTPKLNIALTGGFMALTGLSAGAQTSYAPAAPAPAGPPSAGVINDWLRKQSEEFKHWDIGGSLRLRYENKDNAGFNFAGSAGDFKLLTADNNNSYFLERLRLRLGYKQDWYGFLVEGRSSITAGDRRNPNPESDTPVDLHQAYVTLGNPKEFPVTAKIGRQEMIYGEERLVGAFGWNNIGRVFDAAKLTWTNPYFSADFFTSRVVIPWDGHFNIANDYDWFSGVYLTSKLVPIQTTELYFLSRNTAAGSLAPLGTGLPATLVGASPRDIYTFGVRVKSNPGAIGNWDYAAEIMSQFGHFNDTRLPLGTQSLEHEAGAVVLQGGYTFADTFGKPRLGLEYDFATGDQNPTDGKHQTFENLFPTNHKFYGIMDLVSLQNIHDVRLVSSIKPHKKVTLGVDYHSFWLADTHDNFYNVAGAPRGGTAATAPGTYGANPSYSS